MRSGGHRGTLASSPAGAVPASPHATRVSAARPSPLPAPHSSRQTPRAAAEPTPAALAMARPVLQHHQSIHFSSFCPTWLEHKCCIPGGGFAVEQHGGSPVGSDIARERAAVHGDGLQPATSPLPTPRWGTEVGPMRVSASQRMGSHALFCKDSGERINFHLLWFSTSDCIQPFGLLTPLPLPVPDKLTNFC